MTKTALILAVAIALSGCTQPTASTNSAGGDGKPAIKNGKPVPQFELARLNGGSLKTSDLKGKVTVIDFWATWCESCIPEIPHFNELHKKYGDKGVQVLGFTMDSGTAEEIKPRAEEFHIEYPLILSDDKTVEGFGGILGYPTTFVISPDGTIYKKYIGALGSKQQGIEKDIQTLLTRPATSDTSN